VRFILGTHEISWLGRTEIPLFVSRIRLARQKSWPRATAPWSLDSGGFSQLSTHGRWTITTKQYAEEVRRWRDEIGNLQWAAAIDYMCEPEILKKTGMSVALHQTLTVQCYVQLLEIAPEIPWVPVLQGWAEGDHLRHADEYEAAGVQLEKLPLVGVGTICRRQATIRAGLLLNELAYDRGLKLHGFGFKKEGLEDVADALVSADSLAWSTNAYRNPDQRIPGHTHKTCANCMEYALRWREQLLVRIAEPEAVAYRESIRAIWAGSPCDHETQPVAATTERPSGRQLSLWGEA
jgi:hypothetical protein